MAEALSTVLVRSYGLQPGDAVSIFSTNTIWYSVAMWATVRVGGCMNGASPSYGVDEMVHALKTAGTSVLFTLPASLDVALKAAAKVGLGKERVVLLEGEVDGIKTLHDLVLEARWCDPTDPWSIPTGKTNKEVCGYVHLLVVVVHDANVLTVGIRLSAGIRLATNPFFVDRLPEFLVRHDRPAKGRHAIAPQHHSPVPSAATAADSVTRRSL